MYENSIGAHDTAITGPPYGYAFGGVIEGIDDFVERVV
jgi:hypothetical protein